MKTCILIVILTVLLAATASPSPSVQGGMVFMNNSGNRVVASISTKGVITGTSLSIPTGGGPIPNSSGAGSPHWDASKGTSVNFTLETNVLGYGGSVATVTNPTLNQVLDFMVCQPSSGETWKFAPPADFVNFNSPFTDQNIPAYATRAQLGQCYRQLMLYNGSHWVGMGTPMIKAETPSIGGSALTAGQCATSDVSVTGVYSHNIVTVTPRTYPGDLYYWRGYVLSNGTVRVSVCAVTAGTPTASVYDIEVNQ